MFLKWTRMITRFSVLKYLILGIICIVFAFLTITFQHMYDLRPCSLCLIQRYSLFALGILLILTHMVRHFNKVRIAALLFSYLPAVIGFAAGARQVWLEGIPESLRPACTPDLSYMVKILGAYEGIRRFFFSSGGCGKVDFKLFGVSLAHYGAVLFGMYILIITGLLSYKQILKLLRK